MKKVNVQAQTQVTTNTSKAKTAGIFIGGFASGGLLGAVGMHLYHKKKALDEMEKVITNNDVPLNDSDDSEQKNSDFCEVPEGPKHQEPIEPIQTVQESEHVQEEVPEESEPVQTVHEPETEEPDLDQEEIEPLKGGERNEISDSKETSENGHEPNNEATEQETVPEVQEVQCKKSAPAQVVTSANPVVQKVIDLLNGETTICDETGEQRKAQNIYDVIAYAIMLIADNPKIISRDEKIELLSILRKAGADMESRALVSFVYQFYNETISNPVFVCAALNDANMIQKRTVSFSEQNFVEIMSKYAIDAASIFIDTIVTDVAYDNVIEMLNYVIEMLNYVVDKGVVSLDTFRRIVEIIKKISCFLSKQKENGKVNLALMHHFRDIVEASGIKYTDIYYDDIYPVINDDKAPLQVLMTDCGEVINKRLVNDFATKNGASELTMSCLKAFPETIENIENLVSENKYGEAKEVYRDMLLPVLSDDIICNQYPELGVIIRNIGDRINDMFIHSLNERFKKERVRHEKKQAAAEALEAAPVEAHEKPEAEAAEDSSIEEEEVKTNTGKTYPAKSKNKNRRRNGRR